MRPIADIRKDYSKSSLEITSVDQNPITQFTRWFEEACSSEIPEPNAFTLATVGIDNRPSARIVLLKGIDNEKFVFYTNYQSAKGKELDANPACALTFFWPALERQVRIEGVASRVEATTSEKYFQSRPRESQIGAWASPQSSIISGREILEERAKELRKKFDKEDKLPKPNQWGGYEVDANEIEFWQGRPNRLHDRIVFYKVEGKWQAHRLAP